MKPLVLVVEDQRDIRDLITLQLKMIGLEVIAIDNGVDAIKLLLEKDFHACLLDWMLPGESGIDICTKIRNTENIKNLPVIMVTALTQPENIIAGLDAGADDYITKPFEMEILQARVRAQLRRSMRPTPANKDVLEFGLLKIDKNQCKVFTSGEEVSLTLTEFKILQTLAEKPGHVFTRAQLIELIQGNNVFITNRTIDTHVAGLRKKMNELADMITTIRGIGYAFKAE